ncbi:LIC11966 family surface protein [Flavobacterium sp.]|uniref:LIC11966 family surface protein n=1 Tax=Flavobacterium sp. TaxID=239 RepID=UPI0040336305
MKRILLGILLIVSLTCAAQEFKTPIDYLNFIGKESKSITANTWKYTKAVAHSKSARKIDATRKNLIKSIQAASKKIGATNGYKGDVVYRDQLLAYYSISEKYINDEYDKIIDMQEVAEQSYDLMEAYILTRDMVNEKINAEIEKLNTNQKEFANKYNIAITDDETELGKKMEISNQVFRHQSDMYLIFFKVYITDANLMKAVQDKNINTIQQNASALESFVAEGLEKLKAAKPFKNDMMLVNGSKKALEFYKKEALEFAPAVTDFLMLNQKAEETKKAMDAKGKPSKAEIDAYNKTVADLNKAVDAYNKLTTKFHNDRNNAITAWNAASDGFVSKHVPKD